LQYFEHALQLMPDDPLVLYSIGEIYVTTQDIPKAEEIYSRLQEAYPDPAKDLRDLIDNSTTESR